LDTVLAPDFPKRRIIGTYSQNVRPAITMFAIRAATVAKGPYSLTRINIVVSTAGPTIRGTPKGTAPRLSGSI
jgi:hypothetical protein